MGVWFGRKKMYIKIIELILKTCYKTCVPQVIKEKRFKYSSTVKYIFDLEFRYKNEVRHRHTPTDSGIQIRNKIVGIKIE